MTLSSGFAFPKTYMYASKSEFYVEYFFDFAITRFDDMVSKGFSRSGNGMMQFYL